jgi:hypothetical protein
VITINVIATTHAVLSLNAITPLIAHALMVTKLPRVIIISATVITHAVQWSVSMLTTAVVAMGKSLHVTTINVTVTTHAVQ